MNRTSVNDMSDDGPRGGRCQHLPFVGVPGVAPPRGDGAALGYARPVLRPACALSSMLRLAAVVLTVLSVSQARAQTLECATISKGGGEVDALFEVL